jgi:hypothetical protein
VKVDHLQQFNRAYLNVGEEVLNRLFEREPGLWVSMFNDAVAGKTFTAGVVEVRALAGDYDEGVYQSCVVAGAMVRRLKGLRRLDEEGEGSAMGEGGELFAEVENDNDEDMPVVGWVVHGHFWYLHIAYQRKDGNIVSILPLCWMGLVTERALHVIGPFRSGNTATYAGIILLMNIIRSFKNWAKEEYWPRLKTNAESLEDYRGKSGQVPWRNREVGVLEDEFTM